MLSKPGTVRLTTFLFPPLEMPWTCNAYWQERFLASHYPPASPHPEQWAWPSRFLHLTLFHLHSHSFLSHSPSVAALTLVCLQSFIFEEDAKLNLVAAKKIWVNAGKEASCTVWHVPEAFCFLLSVETLKSYIHTHAYHIHAQARCAEQLSSFRWIRAFV